MKKFVALAAAGLMVVGGAVLSAPAASAYPLGADPASRMVGSNDLEPRDVTAVRSFNYTPRCTATMTVTRPNRSTEVLDRVRTISVSGSATFAFKAPRQTGRYLVKVKQLKKPGCAGFASTTRFRVSR